MAKHRLNLFRLPTTRVADELRAATPKVDGVRRRVVRPRTATIHTVTQRGARARLSNGETAYRDENGNWHMIVGKTGEGSQPLGKRWRGICELAYETALRGSASTEDA
jgi:hypothetical protein